jgi:hypothetical protein
MTQGNSSNLLIKLLGSAAFVGLIAVIALIFQVVSSRNDDIAEKTQQANQAILIAQQQTQIALADEQKQLQVEQLTLVVQQGQLFTPNSSDNGDFSLTATAFFVQAAQIEATSQAIATRQKSIEATQTAVALQATPSVVIRADDVTPQIKGVDNGIQNALSWWKEYEPTGDNGVFAPVAITGKKCYGLAWNTNQYGYHRLIVFQQSTSLTFAAGGWYVKVCIPDYIVISAEDVGKIKTNWLGKRYGDIQKNPWQVIVNP